MRKIGLIALFICCLFSFFWKEAGGIFFQLALRVQANLHFSYREVLYSEGRWTFTNAALFDADRSNDALMVQADSLSISWPLRIELLCPHMTLSRTWAERLLEPSSWDFEAVDGRLDWSDLPLPIVHFSCKAANGQIQELFVDIPQQKMALDGGLFEGFASLSWKGSDFHSPHSIESILRATDHFRLDVTQAKMQRGDSVIENLQSTASYQRGVGGKWEGSALANSSLPIHFETRMTAHLQQPIWVEGNAKFGNAKGCVCLDKEYRFEWEQVGVNEMKVIQDFAQISPDLQLVRGSIAGTGSWSQERFCLDKLLLEDLEMKTYYGSFGCNRAFYDGKGSITEGWLQSPIFSAVHWSGLWDGDLSCHGMIDGVDAQAAIKLNGPEWQASVQAGELFVLQAKAFVGKEIVFHELKGNLNGVFFEGDGKWTPRSGHYLIHIPHFSGAIRNWHASLFACPLIHADIRSIDSGLMVEGKVGQPLLNWSLALKLDRGAMNLDFPVSFSNLSFELRADSTELDFSNARAICDVRASEQTITIALEAPQVHLEENRWQFDVRSKREMWDVLRIVGERKGDRIEIDSVLSHFFGRSLHVKDCVWDAQGLESLQFQTGLSLSLLQSLIGKTTLLQGDVEVQSRYLRGKPLSLNLKSDGALPFEMNLENSCLAIRSDLLQAAGILMADGNGVQIKQGQASYAGMNIAFEGLISSQLQAEFTIESLQGDVNEFNRSYRLLSENLNGVVEGKGFVSLSLTEARADLDLIMPHLEGAGFTFENSGPIHLFLSSQGGIEFTGLDCRLVKDNVEVLAKASLSQIDMERRHWLMQKAFIHMSSSMLQNESLQPLAKLLCIHNQQSMGIASDPSSNQSSIDLTADIDCSFDLSEIRCNAQELFIPVGGQIRHLMDLQLLYTPESIAVNCIVFHQNQQAKIALNLDMEDGFNGRLVCDELTGETPLIVDWAVIDGDVSIHAIEGVFAGVEAAFHAYEQEPSSRLIGTARINFERLAAWLPPQTAHAVALLGMGKGYELMGHLTLNRKTTAFDGILSGKQLEFCDYELRTLLSQIALDAQGMRLSNLKLSDSAGVLKIDQLHISANGDISVPKLLIEDLRPSLLHRPQETPGELSPLIIRRLSIADFQGQIYDASTFTAKGDLSFLNSFKRTETVFDLPSNVIGRIIGLDLDLLIPVKGNLSFALKDGRIALTELKDSFSEGERSQFFLVFVEDSPKIDLEGNIQILIRMEQFVLFKFTDAFLISVDGTIKDPRYRLKKKGKFVSLEQ